ncbi:xanthine dehydrogenase small subunit [Salinisphaera sp. Q1T1-3]|uniref:xanthine dehydrogenase small subunit n=1 Tax=Salinisphaera sp. Q1T1-3 TaxID=2321229 RepID=UPI000E73AC5B|nr:xanthine dehydrogenase small subunit [Salinisphaera sp. Q1T1-3]RJS93801.1 xanthine dehydrogenase small subunit [Salinisphaera sp. Q1T1-3]
MRHTLRFLLGDTLQELTGVDPTQTVLAWLRANGHTGTKEGCAEGDCGACTVVIGRADADGAMVYRALNACIMFVGMLDGAQLLTVAHLAAADGTLHPVQQALVDHHGSQCGFCTPGFVMSLYSFYRSGQTPTRAGVSDAIAGNLCRCTGYRPIVDAALCMHDYPVVDAGDTAAIAARLRALDDGEPMDVGDGDRRFIAPRDLAGVQQALARHPTARLVAGGTDVGLWVTKQHRDLAVLIHLSRVSELQGIATSPTTLIIGGATTHATALSGLAALHADIGELFRRFGSCLIRNASTVGGNIANGSPIGDSMPVLIALGAEVELAGPVDRRRVVLEALYRDYQEQARASNELVARIVVPRLSANQRFGCYKLSKRFDQDISAVCAAFRITLDAGRVIEARLAFGGMAAIPIRARRAEAALVGQAWNEASVAAARDALAEELSPISDMRASASYRQRAAAQLLHRFWVETTTPETSTRVLAAEPV